MIDKRYIDEKMKHETSLAVSGDHPSWDAKQAISFVSRYRGRLQSREAADAFADRVLADKDLHRAFVVAFEGGMIGAFIKMQTEADP